MRPMRAYNCAVITFSSKGEATTEQSTELCASYTRQIRRNFFGNIYIRRYAWILRRNGSRMCDAMMGQIRCLRKTGSGESATGGL